MTNKKNETRVILVLLVPTVVLQGYAIWSGLAVGVLSAWPPFPLYLAIIALLYSSLTSLSELWSPQHRLGRSPKRVLDAVGHNCISALLVGVAAAPSLAIVFVVAIFAVADAMLIGVEGSRLLELRWSR